MKDNKGFIATTLIYSFLLLFATLVVVIIGNYTYYRNTLIRYNQGINDALNNRIDGKYITLYNEISNSDFEVDGSWTLSDDAEYTDEASITSDGMRSLKLTYVNKMVNERPNNFYPNPPFGNGFNSQYTNAVNDTISTTKSNDFQCFANSYYYISYNIFTTGNIDSTIYMHYWHQVFLYWVPLTVPTAETGKIGLYKSDGTAIFSIPINYPFQNWERTGILGKATEDGQCQFQINYVNHNDTFMYLDNVVVADVTEIVKGSGLLDNDGNLSSDNNTILTEKFSDLASASGIKYFSNYLVYNIDNLRNDLN